MPPTTMPAGISAIGKPMDRTDGRLKVTGAARYAADAPVGGVVHAVAVTSPIAKGRIKSIDDAAVKKMPGVLAVMTQANAPKLKNPKPDFLTGGTVGENRLPLSDDKVHYVGQHVAVVIAETLAEARHAAEMLKVDYDPEPAVLDRAEAVKNATMPPVVFGEPLQHHRGNADEALASPDAVKVQATYVTPVENHNPMELSGTVAVWEEDKLTVYDATQWVMGVRATLAEAFNLPRENVRAICPFVGGGFGCKGWQWPHTLEAAMAAKIVGRPVKLSLTRPQMFTGVGHRPETTQRVTLAAAKDGRLTAIRHEVAHETSFVGDYVEACAAATSKLMYACANVDLPHKVYQLNIGTPTPMRAPGECPGSFALECAMDELAVALKMDPVELRVINHSDKQPEKDLPWSSKHLKECYQIAAEKFAWAKRNPEPRSMRDPDGRLVGYGMATATYPGYMFPASARIRLMPDGRAVVTSATHDLGTGAYTAFTQIAADALGLPPERVKFELGDSSLPPAPVAGGSNSTASVGQAIVAATATLRGKLAQMATADPRSLLNGVPPDRIALGGGELFDEQDKSKREKLEKVIGRNGKTPIEADGSSAPGEERKKYAFQSFGCHFVEVKVDEPLARVRVTRVVSAIDNGRVINRKTGRSQILGGVIMGVGMALMEETVFNPDGRPINANLADYAVCVNPDIHDIDVHFIDRPDPYINAMGARGIGEIAIVGVAAAVANAVYHATGKRVRELPITPDKLL